MNKCTRPPYSSCEKQNHSLSEELSGWNIVAGGGEEWPGSRILAKAQPASERRHQRQAGTTTSLLSPAATSRGRGERNENPRVSTGGFLFL